MIRQLLGSSVRSLLRGRLSSVANLVSLTLAILGAIVVVQIISFEHSFDAYHPQADRLYRLVRDRVEFGKTQSGGSTPYPYAEALRAEVPELESVSIVDALMRTDVFAAEQRDGSFRKFSEREGIAHVEPQFLEMFSYDWIAGSPATALQNAGSVVISRSLSQKYFGNDDPMGRTILVDNADPVIVTGIVEDVPKNTNLPFNMLVAFDQKRIDKNWSDNYGPVQCYVRLHAGVTAAQVDAKLPDFLKRHLKDDEPKVLSVRLQPLSEVHFDARYGSYNRVISDGTIWALVSIAIALLVLACVNVINLLSARALDRMKESGIRRVLGSTRTMLALHVYADTGLLVIVSLTLALLAATPVVAHIDYLIGYSVNDFSLFDPTMVATVVCMGLALVVTAGSVPALIQSRVSGTISSGRRGNPGRSRFALRRMLVVVQFIVSQILLMAGLVIYEQTSFLVNADMGFEREGIVDLPVYGQDAAVFSRLKTGLLSHHEIRSVGFSNTGTASDDAWGGNFTFIRNGDLRENHADVKFIDDDFMGTYGLSLVAGEPIPHDGPQGFLVNESLARALGFGDDVSQVIGGTVKLWGREAPVRGVMRDFHAASLREELEPIVFMNEPQYRHAGVRIGSGNISATLDVIRQEWESAFPDKIFRFEFLDDTIRSFYESELRIGRLVGVMTAIAVLIGSLGLFGLTAVLARKRRKEIGIRKVLGASAPGVFRLLSKEFILLVSTASLIGWPVAYVLMTRWLETYAYRVEIGPAVFMTAGLAAVTAAFIAISGQVIRAARANPVESLRYE